MWMVQNGFDPFLSALELDVSADELYERHINGKAVAIKKNRFWFGSNRTPFGGSETGEYRQSALYRAQHRTSGIYDNKMERFIREDFVATKFLTRAMPMSWMAMSSTVWRSLQDTASSAAAILRI